MLRNFVVLSNNNHNNRTPNHHRDQSKKNRYYYDYDRNDRGNGHLRAVLFALLISAIAISSSVLRTLGGIDQYGGGEEKQSNDIDLLVAHGDVPRASSIGIQGMDNKSTMTTTTTIAHDSSMITTRKILSAFSIDSSLSKDPHQILSLRHPHHTWLEGDQWKSALNRTVLAYPVETWNHPGPTRSTISNPALPSSWPLQDLGLKVFVYDTSTWPPELGTVSQCVLAHYLNASEFPSPSHDNRITDVGMIELFQTYPGRTYDPQQADVFVVPYPHASHCMSDGCRPGPYRSNCGGVPQSMIDDLVDQQLTYFRGNDIDRHLFVLSTSHQLNKKLQMAALKFVIGGRVYKLDRPSKPYLARMNPRHKTHNSLTTMQLGNFIMPYMNTHPWMQPSIIRARSTDWWTTATRPRKYSFVYIFGHKNRKATDDSRIHRRQFQKHLAAAAAAAANNNNNNNKKANQQQKTVGGLPYVLVNDPGRLTPEAMLKLYQESTFCPCLPGDTVTQKRFFDVILSGCLPVVLKFPRRQQSENGTDTYSWHPFERSLLEDTFPFAHPEQYDGMGEKNHHHPYLRGVVNYSSFVVQVDLPVDSGSMEQSMAELLLPSNAPELRRRQLEMSRVAPLLTYGLGPENAHRYEDAFSTLLRALKVYLDKHLPPRDTPTTPT